MDLVHRFLRRQLVEAFDKPVNLRPQIAFQIIFCDHRGRRVGQGVDPHDVEITTPGMEWGTAGMTEQGGVVGHGCHCTSTGDSLPRGGSDDVPRSPPMPPAANPPSELTRLSGGVILSAIVSPVASTRIAIGRAERPLCSWWRGWPLGGREISNGYAVPLLDLKLRRRSEQ